VGTIISLIERETESVGWVEVELPPPSVCGCACVAIAQPRAALSPSPRPERDYGDPSVRKVPRSRNENTSGRGYHSARRWWSLSDRTTSLCSYYESPLSSHASHARHLRISNVILAMASTIYISISQAIHSTSHRSSHHSLSSFLAAFSSSSLSAPGIMAAFSRLDTFSLTLVFLIALSGISPVGLDRVDKRRAR
jgi:hypothetical protein